MDSAPPHGHVQGHGKGEEIAPAIGAHDLRWITSNLPPGLDPRFEDTTEERSVLALMGRKARRVLAKVCDADLSNAGSPSAYHECGRNPAITQGPGAPSPLGRVARKRSQRHDGLATL
ncbi:MAG: hypothetical protein HY553_11290 [Elusimicrobia bacterium]|nr:hypothetical protein [Elusimicrobiota bacterium]